VVTRLWGRLLVAALVAVLGAALQSGSAPAAKARPAGKAATRSFFVGTDEDSLLWGNSQQTASIARSLGLRAIHITMRWQPGQTQVTAVYQRLLDKLQLDTGGLRLVVSVYGKATDAPQTDAARGQYCDFVADLVRRNPEIEDVVIWNDPNDGTFWMPQFDPGGASVAPAQYEALLARCWDEAHAASPDVNVISAAVSKSSTIPGAFTLAWHPPAIWINKLAAAYRASRRTKPIFDTFGYVPHPAASTERPWTTHPGSSAISIGDYSTLVDTLGTAFAGTGQPLPGQGSTTIWYLAQGYQTTPDPAKASLYSGTETDTAPVPSWSPNEASDTREGPGLDQAMQLEDAVAVAYCQPDVGAYFNFHLVDETDLAGWQSGVFWADGTPKASYQALHNVTAAVNARSIDCAAFANGLPPRPAPIQQVLNALQILNLKVATLSAFGATLAWQTTNPAKVQVSYGLSAYGVPTIWAPVASTGGGNGQVASLVGLDSGSAYRVWVSAVGDDGQRVQATVDLTTPGLPPHPAVALARSAGAVMLDGQPFFPMIVYSVCPWEYAADLASGINLFALNACGTLQAQLNALGGAAYSTAVAGGQGASGAGLIGWFHMDEPDGSNVGASALPGPPPGVTGLSFLTLTNHFYSGAAALPWGRGMYPGLIAKADVIGFDLYPLQEWCRPERLADVFYAQRELVNLAGPKPTFQWIEADNWNCAAGPTAVTPATVRAESWLAIAGGAHGLGFWPAKWPSANGATIAGVARDVARLGPAVYMPGVAASDNAQQVQISARTWGGALYVIAVNSSYSPADATITAQSLNGRTLTVMGESRRVDAVGDSFQDHFAPLAVHIYIAPPPDN
jgi:hypothetical protein